MSERWMSEITYIWVDMLHFLEIHMYLNNQVITGKKKKPLDYKDMFATISRLLTNYYALKKVN